MNKQETKEAVTTAARVAAEVVGPPNRVVLRVVFIILAVAGVLWVIYKLTGVILLLVLSIFFAYLVSPLVDFIRRPRRIANREIKIPRGISIVLAYLAIMVVILLAIFVVLPSLSAQFPEFATQAKDYWKALGDKSQQLNQYFRSRRIPDPVVDAAKNEIGLIAGRASTTASELFASGVSYLAFLPWLVLIPILAFFLLKDVDSFRRSALQMLPRGRWRWRGDEFFQDVNSTLAAYTRAQLTACLLIGLVCALGFTVLRLPGGLVMGLIAGVFEFVPLVGPLLIAVMAGLLALFHAGPFNAFLILLFLGILRIAQDYFIYPRLIGQGIHLHPLAVIFAILCGAELAGIAGIFLAIPVVAILTVSYRHWMEHRGSEGLADLLETTHITPTVLPANTEHSAQIHPHHHEDNHPDIDTTPEEMAIHRPDLTTGELKMPE
ncbi:MAG TPA: AI-2E family transporter [Pyrinomonadaceae bacterium]